MYKVLLVDDERLILERMFQADSAAWLWLFQLEADGEEEPLSSIQNIAQETIGSRVWFLLEEKEAAEQPAKPNAVIRRTIDIIEEQLGNAKLSLNWVAKEKLYMNPDYLGKLFKKETGYKFSHYVMKRRMELAKQLMAKEDLRIFELAERLGFGNNPQYFSQVFKRWTGCTPSEYRRLRDNSAF